MDWWNILAAGGPSLQPIKLERRQPRRRIVIQAKGNLQQPICGACNASLPPLEMNRGYYFKPKENPDWWSGAIADICIQCPQCRQEVKVAGLGISEGS